VVKSERSILTDKLTQHVGQNSAVVKRDELFRRVDSGHSFELGKAIAPTAYLHESAGLKSVRDPGDIELFESVR